MNSQLPTKVLIVGGKANPCRSCFRQQSFFSGVLACCAARISATVCHTRTGRRSQMHHSESGYAAALIQNRALPRSIGRCCLSHSGPGCMQCAPVGQRRGGAQLSGRHRGSCAALSPLHLQASTEQIPGAPASRSLPWRGGMNRATTATVPRDEIPPHFRAARRRKK